MNSLPKLIWFCTTLSVLLLLPSTKLSAQPERCNFLVSPQEFNTSEDSDRIIIGQISSRPYIVLSNHALQDSLPLIRTCIPDAFLTSSSLGSYVHIASFDNYRDAKALAEAISDSLGIDVRVIHRNRLRR